MASIPASLALALTLVLANVTTALACACCSHTAWRHVEVEQISPRRLAEIAQMRFAKSAKLMVTEADIDIKGIEHPGEDYRLDVSRRDGHVVFALRDGKDRAGTLTLAMPKTISIFEVDPRGEEKDKGLGPLLYKEWKLTANAAGNGLFHGVNGKDQKMTLVLHGRGRGCTGAQDFTDWTLMIYGPVTTFTLYGALDSAAR